MIFSFRYSRSRHYHCQERRFSLYTPKVKVLVRLYSVVFQRLCGAQSLHTEPKETNTEILSTVVERPCVAMKAMLCPTELKGRAVVPVATKGFLADSMLYCMQRVEVHATGVHHATMGTYLKYLSKEPCI